MHFTFRAILGLLTVLLGIVVAGGALASVILAVVNQERPEAPRGEERQWPVELVALETTSITPIIEAFGTIKAAQQSQIRSELPAEVLRVSDQAVDGAHVVAGHVLAKLDDFDARANLTEAKLAEAEAQARTKQLELDLLNQQGALASAESQFKLAQDTAARQLELHKAGVVSVAALEQAQDGLLGAQAALDARRLGIETSAANLEAQSLTLERAALGVERAQRALAKTEILAPFDGVLSDMNLVAGVTVQPGEPLGLITAPLLYEVVFDLTDEQFARFANGELVGRLASVRLGARGQQQSFDAYVTSVKNQVNKANSGVQVIARLSLAQQAPILRSGAFVEVDLAEPTLTGVVAIPSSALSDDQRLFVLDEENRLVEHSVTLVRRLADRTVIRTDLPAGTQIVSRRYPQLSTGVLAEVFDPNARATTEPPAQAQAGADVDADPDTGTDPDAMVDEGEDAQ